MGSLILLATLQGAWAQGSVPTRQIPPSVLAELQLLENRFEVALAADCDTGRCFSKGCTYVDHSVADQPRATSLPGLGQDPGPGSVPAQEYLTRARCSFAHEESVSSSDVQALMRRLQSKLSKGWTVVTIDHQALQPIPPSLQEPEPEPVPVEPAAVLQPEQWSLAVAARELWTILLPHFYWMIAVPMLTLAGLIGVWAWRRVGRDSLEERALLAQLARTDGDEVAPAAAENGAAEEPSEDDRAFVARQAAAWAHRLEVASVDHPDPELRAMIRELLRSRDLPLLAKAVLRFPDSFLAAFPAGGDIASAKLELADYLKSVNVATLPSDIDFFRALDRHARSAALASQSDAQIVRSLRDEFGATGLVTLIGSVPPRTGALLFALAPADEQREMVRLLSPRQMADMAEQLLRSNRMPRGETAYLFQVLEAARADEPLPPPPPAGEVSDRGAEFDAAGALSVLLPSVRPAHRGALFGGALERFHGTLPAWYRGIFLADMLSALTDEARTDLLLELDVETLAAWLSLLDADTRDRLVEDLPDSLRASVGSHSVFPSRARQLALAERGRQDLARGFQRQLARANVPFERVVHPDPRGWAVKRLACLLLLAGPSCGKVPVHDIQAGFSLADASWFADEETLFVFYEVEAEQGIGDQSVIEVEYTTDGEQVLWTPLSELPSVHTHLPVDCGVKARCGSASIHVPLRPRQVGVRMRYHRDGELALEPDTVFNVVESGPPYTNRSLVVYGVFDETNQRVQWRSRHQFPTLRNERVEELGLRRDFTVRDQAFGTAELATNRNPYGYGVACPSSFVATGFPVVETTERAIFNFEVLPLGASDASTVCGEATVTDATGSFTTGAIARKNPEVRPAFPVLRSPAHDATLLPFFLAPCDRLISAEHEAMLRQRLLLGDIRTTCTDDWKRPEFVGELVASFRDAIESTRPVGNDMVLIIALSQDEPGVAEVVEDALAQVAPDERLRSSPRLAGAFVLDSTPHGLTVPELSPVTLWCPSTVSLDDFPDASARNCAIAPDEPDLVLGPFSFGVLPILPTREDYLDFIETYSDGQAGSVESLTFRTPEFSTISDHIPVGDFGVATFLNNEQIDAAPDDAFSYCVGDDLQLFVFRSDLMQTGTYTGVSYESCEALGIPEEVCAAAQFGLGPIEFLPDWHNVFGERSYELGILWEFPFLLRLEYELVTAGSVSAFGLSVPFGIASPAEAYYGTEVWTLDEFPLANVLTQCTRFCDHPTFDSAGVYHVTDPFRYAYAHACYLPSYPELGDSGSPLDP